VKSFSTRIINWQRQHGRHGLPWQGADAYRVWLSEIMLQQTQVATVIPYYRRFVARFPDIPALAAASEDEVLVHWSGLGYYSRGRNLFRAAQLIMQQHDGKFPHRFDDIRALPGIGRSTAAAISALAFHERRAILDGNVKRVLARYCAIEGYTGEKKIEAQLWRRAEALLPPREVAVYTQGLMDLGAQLCTRSKPRCGDCPLGGDCAALGRGLVAQLPTPRPRKALPEKHSTFLLLLNGRDILLEKRPGKGIWGGLWCPPQLDEEQDISAYCAQHFDFDAARAVALPAFSHTFTHFKLHISPLVMRVAKPGKMEKPDRVWLDVDEALCAAIPTPVRKLLQALLKSPELFRLTRDFQHHQPDAPQSRRDDNKRKS
jgi:A/G-specific adenine glycosylase